MTEDETKSVTLPPVPNPVVTRRNPLGFTALVVALAALGFAGWQWVESREIRQSLRQELTSRIAETDTRVQDVRSAAGQARNTLQEVEGRLDQLEARITESQNQRLALESLYQELSRRREDWSLAEVEQVLLIASQHLHLAGNPKAALIALESADSRLARMDRTQFAALRRAINSDIEKLRALPAVDLAGMSVKLDLAAARVDTLPLATARRAAATVRPAPATDTGFWRTIWREFLDDAGDLVRLERLNSGVPLLAPDQEYFLRENLKLRLLGARLALLSREMSVFRSDLKAASGWLEKYYLAADPSVVSVLSVLRQLRESDFTVDLPDLSASLDTLRSLKLARERTLR